MSRGTDDAARNRAAWDQDADHYQRQHAQDLAEDRAYAWGVWRTPEEEVGLLGDVSGKDVLELGCGAAQWSIALAKRGAKVTGLDNSPQQLRHARDGIEKAGVEVALVLSPAESAPFDDESFDLVLSDYGATLFVDPYVSIPLCARILRTGGTLVFTNSSPFLDLFWDENDEITDRLQRPYFGMHRFEWPGNDTVEFNLPYGEWVNLFRENGFIIERLLEIQPPEGAETSYEGRPLWWSHKWPAEIIWKLTKGSPG